MPVIGHHNPGSFCWFELATTDQAAAKEFYKLLFGWTVNDVPMGPQGVYSMFQLEGSAAAAAYTMLPEQQSQGMLPNWLLYIAVENADDTSLRAASAGGKVFGPAFDVFDAGRMAVLADPTGAVFAVWQPEKNRGVGITGVDGTVCWADLSTPDAAAASQFYSGVFGWQISAGEQDHSGYLHIKNGEDFIGGIPPAAHNAPQTPPHWLIYFLASDCDGTGARAVQLGGQFLLPPMDVPKVGRIAVLKDPQGAVFALYQPAAK